MPQSKAATVFFVVFMLGVIVWRIWETFRKQGAVRGQTSMQWSFYALFALSCVIFGGTAAEFFLVKRPYHPAGAVLGTVLFILANVLRVVAIRALGRFWSLHIEIREQHLFVREGAYRFVRHPAYVSFVLEHIAVPLVGNAWWSLAVTVLVYVPFIRWRIRREEEALVAKFGDRYQAYQRDVSALVPKWSAFRQSPEASKTTT